ncbi:uncharacterized protein E0L32_009631 [Thyridium curvatum]|uniref:DUF6546 domain-containing protein n=1 Tax=Thyridium curvatum TaxID=1093900 RepID=A0A507ANQ2_9PEZI|nr:uncharacterized protein E0L32_009631 [Thyridium curvatum]TPX08927.1 hypothetical protein E0L32_009631 [Thyridium curvatum]
MIPRRRVVCATRRPVVELPKNGIWDYQEQERTVVPWTRLPPEIRLMVLEQVRESAKGQLASRGKRTYEMSIYATVCREWQSFFEKENFKRLILHQSDIFLFGAFTHGQQQRRAWIEWIWLRIELPQYDCKKCQKAETLDEIRNNNIVFTKAVWGLFNILSTWERDLSSVHPYKGLRLELGVYSPSDATHFCKELQCRVNDTSWSNIIGIQNRGFHDKAHGWREERQLRPTGDALRRVFGPSCGLAFDLRISTARQLEKVLPKVNIITVLVIRRQFYRHYSISKALQPIIQSLPQLFDIRYEHWRDPEGEDGLAVRDAEHHILLSMLRAQTNLRRFRIFEDFRPLYHGKEDRKFCPSLGQALAESSQHLDELLVTFSIDAKDFFSQVSGEMMWHNLRLLSLTTPALSPLRHDQLIQEAAKIIPRMPQLKIMELWHIGHYFACVFEYSLGYPSLRPSIRLLSTWDGKLSAEAISCWKEVTNEHRGELRSESVWLDPKKARSHFAIMRLLLVRRRVVHSTSYEQLRSSRHENRFCRA